jgi:ABC-2 type transport system ATP-binding protein
VVRVGDIEALTYQRGQFVIGLAPGQVFPREELARQGYRVTPSGPVWEVSLAEGQDIDAVVDFLRARGLGIRRLSEKRQSLEDIFVQTVEAAEPGVDIKVTVVD